MGKSSSSRETVMTFENAFFAHVGKIVIFQCTLFCVIGLLLVMSGYAMTSHGGAFFDGMHPELVDKLNTFRRNVRWAFPDSYREPLDPDRLAFFGIFTQTISTAFLLLGAGFMLATFGGCLVTRTCSRPPLALLSIFMTVLFSMTIYVFCSAKQFVEDDLWFTLEEYSGLGDPKLEGMAWNMLMVNFECCGIYCSDDFMRLENWPPNDLKPIVNKTRFVNVKALAHTKSVKISVPGCVAINATIGTNFPQYTCEWMDITKWKTPLVCCTDARNITDHCHMDGGPATLNRMNTGCLTKAFSYLTEFGLTYVFFALAVVLVLSFLVVLGLLIYYCAPLGHSTEGNSSSASSQQEGHVEGSGKNPEQNPESAAPEKKSEIASRAERV